MEVSEPGSRYPRRQRRAALACLLLAWVAFVFPMFVGKVHFPTDFVRIFYSAPGSDAKLTSNLVDTDVYLQEYPWHDYLGRELKAGHIPLWDPSRFVGAPFAADISTGTFYPPNWLYALGNVELVSTLIWAGTILVSLLLAYWLLSLLRLHPFAAALGAVVWTFSGFMVSEGMFDALIGAAVWLPMALAGLELARQGRPRLGVPVTGVALALSVLAGHVQIALYVWLAVGIWAGVSALGAAITARASGRRVVRELIRGLGPAVAAGLIGAGLASVQILGTLEYAGQIVRQQETVASASFIRLSAHTLTTALVPDYLGNSLDHNYRSWLGFYIETTIYAGVVTLPLAFAGFWNRRRRLSVAFGLMALVGLTAGLGTPVYHLLFAIVPGVSRTRDITRFKLLFDAGAAGLAALGLDAILSRRRGAVWLGLGTAAVTCAVLLGMTVARWGTSLPAGYIVPRGLRAVLLVGACSVLIGLIGRRPSRGQGAAVALVVLCGADLWLFGFGYHPFQPPGSMYPPTAAIRYLASAPGPRPRYAMAQDNALPVNAALVYGLYSLNGYDPFIPGSFVSLLTQVQPDATAWAILANTTPAIKLASAEPPLLGLLGVRTVAIPGGTTGPGLRADPPAEGAPSAAAVLDQAGAFAPAFVTSCWIVDPDDVALALLKGMSAPDLRSTAVVAPGPGSGALGPSPPSCPAGPAVETVRYGPEDVVLSVPTGATGGIVVLTDQWFPGWTATLDSASVPILRVDGALRGVVVGPGGHRIEFRYQPGWPLLGLATVLFTLSVTGLLVAAPRRRPPRGR